MHASFQPSTRDLSEALWSHWRQACAKAKKLLQFRLTESHSDGASTDGDFNLNIKRIMAARLDSSATSCGHHTARMCPSHPPSNAPRLTLAINGEEVSAITVKQKPKKPSNTHRDKSK